MVTIKEYIAPKTIEEAYELLIARKNNLILGGCGFIKIGSRNINTAIDLCNLSLDYIVENEEEILIGADTTLRQLEINNIIKNHCGGAISQGVSYIVGVQFRNMARVGASVFSRYGFSDLLPSLLVLDAKVRLYKGGVMDLKDFLEKKYEKDILLEVILPKKDGIAVYDCLRKSSGDLPIINGAMFKGNNCEYVIAIGSRPQRAKLAEKSMEALEYGASIDKVADMVVDELHFGTNMRGSREYREEMCKVLIKRMHDKVGGYHDR
ncbi:FAD binding domain-containing protein [Schnuerera ultunensis]|uniref:Putative FAD-binding subunit of xanthine dehydrogenase n=1 Tax=[Clostridium] ultunense Esp TaxID=1288971 RepID=A0A1M4PLL7_9FIRM|nr:FAD binding domain-containing protein [Schnuerera ultunensis]SHD76357.1 putative FAD-binding subunit of xanthine dehydrogenase [[Clostridium] ultunense Esp]